MKPDQLVSNSLIANSCERRRKIGKVPERVRLPPPPPPFKGFSANLRNVILKYSKNPYKIKSHLFSYFEYLDEVWRRILSAEAATASTGIAQNLGVSMTMQIRKSQSRFV
jgi:hypothetical protein